MSKVNTAPIKWAQRSDSLYITIALPGAYMSQAFHGFISWSPEIFTVRDEEDDLYDFKPCHLRSPLVQNAVFV